MTPTPTTPATPTTPGSRDDGRDLVAALGVNITPQVRDRARAAVAALRGTEDAIHGGVSGLVDQALEAEVTRLEQTHNGGKPFPTTAALPRGPQPTKDTA